MTRRTIAFSAIELSRLINGLEGTSHLDTDAIDQTFTDGLLQRLVCLHNQAMADLLQPTSPDDPVQEIADLLFP